MKTLIVASMLACPVMADDVEPVIVLDHSSDLFRGWPVNNTPEPQEDYLGSGITIHAGKRRRFEMDITMGLKSLNRGPTESGTRLTVRFYPTRK